jgi:hypothetical protein
MISSNLPGISGLADRLLEFHEGNLTATLTSAETMPGEALNYVAGLDTSTKEDAVSSQELNKRKEQP